MRLAGPLMISLASLASPLALAGPLNPPAGPVASTMKTLTEVEPRIAINAANTPGDADSVFRIVGPGSYYLTGEILVPPGKRGIEIASEDVTIDLQGFRIGAFAGSLEGIAVVGTFDRNNITVRNGIIRHMQSDGLKLTPEAGDSTGCRIENITVADCSNFGIVAGSSTVIRGCTVLNCGYSGVSSRFSNVIEDCTADGCTGNGISAAQGSLIARCSAENNAGAGITVDYRCRLSECTARGNGTHGLSAQADSLIAGCISTANQQDGIHIDGEGGSVVNCAVSLNDANGIRVLSRTTVRDNNAFLNGYSSTGANILVSGADNRIEGNNCTLADFGIQVVASGNLIIRNSCSGNTTNWSLVANNVYGPIINRSAPASAAVSGDSAASALGSTDPNANFTY